MKKYTYIYMLALMAFLSSCDNNSEEDVCARIYDYEKKISIAKQEQKEAGELAKANILRHFEIKDSIASVVFKNIAPNERVPYIDEIRIETDKKLEKVKEELRLRYNLTRNQLNSLLDRKYDNLPARCTDGLIQRIINEYGIKASPYEAEFDYQRICLNNFEERLQDDTNFVNHRKLWAKYDYREKKLDKKINRFLFVKDSIWKSAGLTKEKYDRIIRSMQENGIVK